LKKPRHLLEVNNFGGKDIEQVLKQAALMKRSPRRFARALQGRTLAMLFAKPSTRTRVSFEVAMLQLGGHSINLDFSDMQVSRGETIGDTARVLSRYVDIIMARLFQHKNIEELAAHSSVPIINGLTDLYHPCQALSDMFTIKESLKSLKGKRLVFLGDGASNVCHSLINASNVLGLEMIVSCPRGYQPKIKGDFRIVSEPAHAAKDADVLYTDTWTSMGQERDKARRVKQLRSYQLNSGLLKQANKGCIVMHCLPAHRGQEITNDVIDGPRSVIFQQAENRMHVQKAILVKLLRG
jgi:ornithine carbamoyltransferase